MSSRHTIHYPAEMLAYRLKTCQQCCGIAAQYEITLLLLNTAWQRLEIWQLRMQRMQVATGEWRSAILSNAVSKPKERWLLGTVEGCK